MTVTEGSDPVGSFRERMDEVERRTVAPAQAKVAQACTEFQSVVSEFKKAAATKKLRFPKLRD